MRWGVLPALKQGQEAQERELAANGEDADGGPVSFADDICHSHE